jgi:hypothetical protein
VRFQSIIGIHSGAPKAINGRKRRGWNGLRCIVATSERRGAFAMTKSCGSASEWRQAFGIASESEGFDSGRRGVLKAARVSVDDPRSGPTWNAPTSDC